MKISLISINSKYPHSSLAVWYLLGGINKYAHKPHEVSVIEATINQSIESIATEIIIHTPDIVGLSTYIWNIHLIPSLVERLRTVLPNIIVLMGGPEVSNNIHYWLNGTADYIIYGEGEYSIAEFIDAVEDRDINRLKSIPGLCFSLDSEAFIGKEVPNLTEYINPYSEEYFCILQRSIAYIESSRGCPFSCSYCLSSNESVRFFPLKDVLVHTKELASYGARTIKFVDRTFNCHPQRAKEIVKYITSLNTEACFHFEVAADLFDDELLSILSLAPKGRIRLEIGLQSFNELSLEAVFRHQNLTKAENNIRFLLKNQNIHIHIDLIAGLPYETKESFINSFNRAYAIQAHTLQLGFLKLLHGSKLRSQAEGFSIKFLDNPPYEVISTLWMEKDDLDELRQVENALQNTYNKGRFLRTMEYSIDTSGYSPYDMYLLLGKTVPHHAISLENYTEQIYSCLLKLPGIDERVLRDKIVCDMLGMTKGKGIPLSLRTHGHFRRRVFEKVKQKLGHTIDYDEIEELTSGIGVYVDSSKRDAVTGLYEIVFIEQ